MAITLKSLRIILYILLSLYMGGGNISSAVTRISNDIQTPNASNASQTNIGKKSDKIRAAIFPSFIRFSTKNSLAGINKSVLRFTKDIDIVELNYIFGQTKELRGLDKHFNSDLKKVWKFKMFSKVPNVSLISKLGSQINADVALLYCLKQNIYGGYLIDTKTSKVYYKQINRAKELGRIDLQETIYNLTSELFYDYLGSMNAKAVISSSIEQDQLDRIPVDSNCDLRPSRSDEAGTKIEFVLLPFYGGEGTFVENETEIMNTMAKLFNRFPCFQLSYTYYRYDITQVDNSIQCINHRNFYAIKKKIWIHGTDITPNLQEISDIGNQLKVEAALLYKIIPLGTNRCQVVGYLMDINANQIYSESFKAFISKNTNLFDDFTAISDNTLKLLRKYTAKIRDGD